MGLGQCLDNIQEKKFLLPETFYMSENSAKLSYTFQREWTEFLMKMNIILLEKIANCFLSITWSDDWYIQSLDKSVVLKPYFLAHINWHSCFFQRFDLLLRCLSLVIHINHIITVTAHILPSTKYGRVISLTPFHLNQQHIYTLFTSN